MQFCTKVYGDRLPQGGEGGGGGYCRIEFLQMYVVVWTLLVNANCSGALSVYFACLPGIRDIVLHFSTSNSMAFLTSYGLENWRVEFL